MQRRTFIPTMVGAGALATSAGAQRTRRTGRLKQAVTRGCFRGSNMSFEDMCRHAARLGAVGFDLIGPDQFPIVKKYGLLPTMVGGGSGIKAGINDKTNHSTIAPKLKEAILAVAEAGAPNVIIMAGDRKGISDEQGMDTCEAFLKENKKLAEDKGITLCMELLNSKVNHPGYMCDHTAWGVELCKRVNSPHFKLLYDIYHMQIMEGDIIRTIRDNIQWIGHFHTAGNPGRHEFDDTQEMNYRGIATAIADLKFDGYFAHEYSPLKDPLRSLDEALTICDV